MIRSQEKYAKNYQSGCRSLSVNGCCIVNGCCNNMPLQSSATIMSMF